MYSIHRYYVSDKGMKPLTNTDPDKGSYYLQTFTNGTENAVLLHLTDIGYLGVEAMCSVDFKKDEMTYKHENRVSLIRRGKFPKFKTALVKMSCSNSLIGHTNRVTDLATMLTI